MIIYKLILTAYLGHYWKWVRALKSNHHNQIWLVQICETLYDIFSSKNMDSGYIME